MPQPHYAPLLLAFLTQTARFHPKLVEQKGSPVDTALFYAEATRHHMGKYDFPGEPTLEKVQALLMLGYHEWTAFQGKKGWIRIGTAIRCAQSLNYQFDAELDERIPGHPSVAEFRLTEKDQFILRETQRRTFWSCCLLDRYLSWGRNRPPMLNPDDFQRIQLPCSDRAFNFGRKVQTRLLGEVDQQYKHRRRNAPSTIKWEVGESEGELTWYIKVVDLFGEIVKWSCSDGKRNGRRQEGTIPPWDPRTKFKKLEDKLRRLKAELPEHLQLTVENTRDRIYNGFDKYVLIHALYTVCTVFLYREYMPMAPWSQSEPRGPQDEPLITETPPYEDYWIDQAKECWKSCKDFIEVLHSIQSSRSPSSLIQMPTVAFAAFTVALCTIYCHYFPSMDPDRTLSSRREPRAHAVAHEYLGAILERFPMAVSWVKHLAGWQRYYRHAKARYKEVGGRVGGSPESSSSESDGSGLKDYATYFEKTHKEFGDISAKYDSKWTDRDLDWKDSALPSEDDHADHNAQPEASQMKREIVDRSMSTPVQTPSQPTPVDSDVSTSAQECQGPVGATVAHLPYQPTHQPTNSSGSVFDFYPPPSLSGYGAACNYNQLNLPTNVHSGGVESIPRSLPIGANVGHNPEIREQMEKWGNSTFNSGDVVYPEFMGDASMIMGQAYDWSQDFSYPGYGSNHYSNPPAWPTATESTDYAYHNQTSHS